MVTRTNHGTAYEDGIKPLHLQPFSKPLREIKRRISVREVLHET
jgi:hypothetical protein